jgi:hypothetical protein
MTNLRDSSHQLFLCPLHKQFGVTRRPSERAHCLRSLEILVTQFTTYEFPTLHPLIHVTDGTEQFFIGRELNPRVGSLDLKVFNELRPGLVLWALIDISMACAQAVRLGGRVTDSMWLVLICQIWYVGDSLYYEVRRSTMVFVRVYMIFMHLLLPR